MSAWDEGIIKPLRPPRVSHTCGKSSVMPECSNQRTSERAQLLAAMTHPSRVLNNNYLDIRPKSYIYTVYRYIMLKNKVMPCLV